MKNENKFYTPKYLYSFKDEILYTTDYYEAKNLLYTFTINGCKWRTFIIPFNSIENFVKYNNKIFGYIPKEVYECWIYKNKEGNILSYLLPPEECSLEDDLEFLGKFYCDLIKT